MVRLSEVLGPDFYDLAGDVFRHGHTHYDLSGGRGSLKSSAVSLMVPVLLMRWPGTHALVMRKVANTLRSSVFAQYQWALGMLGVDRLWTARPSAMELEYRPTGQKILFRGADDPAKLRSVKVPFGYIAVTHFEEKDQFAGREEIRAILQGTMRGGELFWNFETYNPPLSREHWANADAAEDRPDRLRHKSCYLHAPRQWLGEAFFAEAERLRRADERAWRHEYLGEAVGTGANVFQNILCRTITDEQIAGFDRIYQGVDWGWYPDKFAFLRVYHDSARERIYLIDEYYVNFKSNRETAIWVKEKGYYDYPILCDSAEPKSIGDWRQMGLPARGAVKGPGSVEYGFKWLQSRTIVIDRARTPAAWREISGYEYRKDRLGRPVSGYPDRDDHAISALRYAMEPAIMARGHEA